MIIYKVINKINGKIYIGQTIYSVDSRIKGHLKGAGYFQRALRKYGIQSFDVSIIDTADNKDILNEKEKYWIKKLNSLTPNGYNISIGGTGGNLGELVNKKRGDSRKGLKHTEETKEKIRQSNLGKVRSEEAKVNMSKAQKGRIPWNKGVVCSEETKKKIGNSNSGKIRSEESKKKMAAAHKGKHYNIGQKPWNKGISRTEEEKKKISNSLKGNIPWNKGVPRTDLEKKKMSISHKGLAPWNKGLSKKKGGN